MAETLDLRGIRCPLNWAHAKVRLETMPPRTTLVLVVDDPRARDDIPRAAEASGHHVVEVDVTGPPWRIVLEV
jgi:TusA-related sulfurtransferase